MRGRWGPTLGPRIHLVVVERKGDIPRARLIGVEAYPFRGAWRWAVLPVFLTTAGALDGLVGWGLQREEGAAYLPIWIVPEANHALAVGLAMAGTRHPVAALILALILGFPTPWLDAGMLQAMPLGISGIVTPWMAGVARAAGSAFIVLTHHLYLRARRRGRGASLPVLLVYGLAGILSAFLLDWGFRGTVRIMENLRWGIQSALLSWMALVVVARLSERAAPAPTPPAPEA